MSTVLIDLCSSASYAQGHPVEQYVWLRANDPVHWHDEPGGAGFWAVSRYADVETVSLDNRLYSSRAGILLFDLDEETLAAYRTMMLLMDPPDHVRYRRLVAAGFTPKAARALAGDVAEVAARIVDEVIDRGECDFVTDVAGKLPSYFIARLLGIPLEDGVMLYRWTELMHSAPDVVSQADRTAAGEAIFGYAAQVARDKRAAPADDLSSKLIHSEVDGERLSDPEFVNFFLLLVNAGGDTTRNALGGGLHALFEHPDQWARLRDGLEEMLPTAVEEILRWTSPVVHMRRTATADTILGDQKIAAGDKVVMFYGSANRDESVFASPERFDISRTPNEHVAFGARGPHFCLGAYLARIEITAMLRELVSRLPGIEPTAAPTWLASNFISGPTQLPVRFTPSAARAQLT